MLGPMADGRRRPIGFKISALPVSLGNLGSLVVGISPRDRYLGWPGSEKSFPAGLLCACERACWCAWSPIIAARCWGVRHTTFDLGCCCGWLVSCNDASPATSLPAPHCLLLLSSPQTTLRCLLIHSPLFIRTLDENRHRFARRGTAIAVVLFVLRVEDADETVVGYAGGPLSP